MVGPGETPVSKLGVSGASREAGKPSMRSNNKVGRNGWNCGIRAARCPSPSWKESAKSLMEKGPTAPHRVSTRKALYCVCVCAHMHRCVRACICVHGGV